jgi:pimeloyl-ACP methyl ester carboxylesterase
MFHTAVAGRHQPRRLIAALQAAGWRPISFDRPGYGLSDMAGADPFAAAAADVTDILDVLEIDRVTIMARSGSTAAVTTAAAMPHRIAGGVLVGPDPPVDLDSRHTGMMGRGKALFFGNSALATAFARILSRRTSSAQIIRMQRQSVAGSAIDEAVLDDPDAVTDIVRASRQAALGMKGFLAEMLAHGGGARPPALGRADDWVVIAGAQDPLYDFETSRDFWQHTLPGAMVHIVPGGGRWLHLTHTPALVAALASVAARW